MFTTSHFKFGSAFSKMFLKKYLKFKDTESTEVEIRRERNSFHNTLNRLGRMFSDQLFFISATLIKNVLTLSESLSVAVVPHTGIISPEFLQTLTRYKDYRLKLNSINLLRYKLGRRLMHSIMVKDVKFVENQFMEKNELIICKEKEIFSKEEEISVDNFQNFKLDKFKISKDKFMKKNQNLKVRRKKNFISKCRKFGQTKCQLQRFGVGQTKRRKLKNSSMKAKLVSAANSKRNIRLRLISESSDNSEDSFITLEEDSESESVEETESEIKDEKPMRKRVKHIPENYIKGKVKVCEINEKIVCPRLSSESSSTSEDSFVVFQADLKSDNKTESSFIESEYETETESENEDNISKRKVRFNLIPTIYDIDCERCVPFSRWMEEMRKFRERIKETGLILEPIFNLHHRSEVCKQRFSIGE